MTKGTDFESLVFAHHLGKLIGGIGAGVEHLRGDAAVVFAHKVQDLRSLTSLVFTKTLGTEFIGMAKQIVYLIFIGVPRHVHKQLDGIFHRFQVAHVQDPKFLDTTVIGQLQLFPHILDGGDIDPLRISGRTHIVHMVIEAPAALTLLLLGCRQSPHITPVIVAKQHRHVVGHTKSGIVIVLYFFI